MNCTSSPWCDEDCCKCDAWAEHIAQVNEFDNFEIATQIKAGNTSGLLDRDGYRVTWELKTEIFKN